MKNFTTGSVPRLMVSFLVPLLVGNILQGLYILIDAFWAGRLLGTSGVAVVAIGMPVAFLMSSVFIGLTVGASILAGQAFGANDRERLSHIISTSLIVTLALAVTLSTAGVLCMKPLLRLINTPAPLLRDARVFLSIIVGGMVVSCLVQWFAAIMNAIGDSRTPFRIVVVSLAVNAILAPALITGAGFLPRLGIAGSALATVLASVTAVVLCFSAWRGHHVSAIAPVRWRVEADTLRRIIAVGTPLAAQMVIVSSSFLFILSQANAFGPAVTAAFGIGSRVDQFVFLALFAVTAAVSAMTAQNYGVEQYGRIGEIARWGALLAVGIALVFAALVMLFPGGVAGLFTGDPAVHALTRHYFWAVGLSYVGLAVLFSYQGVVRGAGDTIASLLITAMSMVVFRVPLCYALSHATPLHETGLWLGITLSSFAGAAAFYMYYISGRWKKKDAGFTAPDGTARIACIPEEAV